MVMFGLESPFTAQDVDRAWRALLKNGNIHPDERGTDEKFIEVQQARELLKEAAGGK